MFEYGRDLIFILFFFLSMKENKFQEFILAYEKKH